MRGKLLGANDETPSRYYDNQNGVNHYNIMIVKIMMMMIMMMIMMIMMMIMMMMMMMMMNTVAGKGNMRGNVMGRK